MRTLTFKDFLGWDEEGKHWYTRWVFPIFITAYMLLMLTALIGVLTEWP